MKFIQLGNGGGLNPLETNSSFLIQDTDDEHDLLLFDCGSNIVPRLLQLEEDSDFHISDIKRVFISHIHDDHIGSLETLIYWNYFKNQITMDVNVPLEVEERYEKCRKILYDGEVVDAPVVNIVDEFRLQTRPNGEPFASHFVEGNHGGTPSEGFYIPGSDGTALFISGDTKASDEIEEDISNLDESYKTTAYIFHDFSYWDDPSKNVHMCQTDMDSTYSLEFIERLHFYHTSDVFISDWITITKDNL